MDGKEEKVRLIGLDTPETKKPNSPVECFGKAASDYAHKLMDNQSVRLEADPINTNRDRYDRLLRYVYLKDGRMVNSEMIKQGYGFAYLSFPFTKSDEFRQIQKQARETEQGLWANGACQIRDENGRYKTNSI
jgi:micrococcal nuclease